MTLNEARTIGLWNEWNATSAPNYPQEKVVQFCLRNYPNREVRPETRALDWGCGSGVNTAFLCAEGFHVSATDVSPVAIENTRKRLAKMGLTAELINEDLTKLSIADSSIDLVICIGVLDSVGRERAYVALQELPRILRSGARGIFLFAEEHDGRCAGNINLHRYARADVESLFRKFPEVYFDQYVTTYMGGAEKDCDWLVTIRA